MPPRRTTSKQFGITRNERGARRENEKEKQFNGRNKNKMITELESEWVSVAVGVEVQGGFAYF